MTDSVTPAIVRERAELVRSTLVYAGAGTALSCALVLAFGDPRLALAIALGAVIAAANFLLLARGIAHAIDRTLDEPEADPASPSDNAEVERSDPAHKTPARAPEGLRSGLRLALLLLAMLGILWYMPARPEGLAVGVLLVLLAATIAGYRHNRAI